MIETAILKTRCGCWQEIRFGGKPDIVTMPMLEAPPTSFKGLSLYIADGLSPYPPSVARETRRFRYEETDSHGRRIYLEVVERRDGSQ